MNLGGWGTGEFNQRTYMHMHHYPWTHIIVQQRSGGKVEEVSGGKGDICIPFNNKDNF